MLPPTRWAPLSMFICPWSDLEKRRTALKALESLIVQERTIRLQVRVVQSARRFPTFLSYSPE